MGPEHPQRLEKQSGEDSVNVPRTSNLRGAARTWDGAPKGLRCCWDPQTGSTPEVLELPQDPHPGARPPLPEESQPTLDDAGRGQRGSLPSSPFQLNQRHPWPNQIRSSWEESPANSLLGLSAPTPVHSRVGGMRVEERAGEWPMH